MKKAIVLGGSRGIGRGITDALTSVCDVHSYSSSSVDTGNMADIDKLIMTHKNTDILVLNTGGPPAIDFFEISEKTWETYHSQLFLGFCRLLQNMKINDGGYVFLISDAA